MSRAAEPSNPAQTDPESTTPHYSTYENSCAATTNAGLPCRAHPLQGSGLCFFHDPASAAARRQAQATGGAAPRSSVVEDMSYLGFSFYTPVGIQAAIEHVFRLQLIGRIPERQAASMARFLRLATANARAVMAAEEVWEGQRKSYVENWETFIDATDVIVSRLAEREDEERARGAVQTVPDESGAAPVDRFPDNLRFLDA